MFRKPWNANKDGCLDLVMSEWNDDIVDPPEEEIETLEVSDTEEVVNESE